MVTSTNFDEALIAVPNCNCWIVDSGATSHISHDRSAFVTYHPPASNHFVFPLNKKSPLPVVGVGDVRIQVLVNNRPKTVLFSNILHVPGAGCNLFSLNKATTNGNHYKGDHDTLTLFSKDNTPILEAFRVDSLQVIHGTTAIADMAFSALDLQLWHQRLAHLRPEAIQSLSTGLATGILMLQARGGEAIKCLTCVQAKTVKKPIAKVTATRSTTNGERFFSDLAGPINVKSYGGASYLMTCTDDNSRFLYVFFLPTKSSALPTLDNFFNFLDTQFGIKPKYFRSDQGGEFGSKEGKAMFARRGIIHEKTAPYTPKWNGVSERLNLTIFDKVRAFLIDSGLPPSLWAEAARHATWIKNRTPTKAVDKTPFEVWFGKSPDLSSLRTFGCYVEVLIQSHKPKLAPRTQPAFYLGNDDTHPAIFRLWNDRTKRVFTSRNVHFFEGLNLQVLKYPAMNTGEGRSTLLLPSGTYSIPKMAPAEEYDSGSDSEIDCIHHVNDTKPILVPADLNDNSSSVSNGPNNVSSSGNVHEAPDYGYPRRQLQPRAVLFLVLLH